MLVFLKWISEEISKITEEMVLKNEPMEDLKEGEKELTILNEDEKKIFALAEKTKAKIEQLALAHRIRHQFIAPGANIKEECDQFWKDSFNIFTEFMLIKDVALKSVGMRIQNNSWKGMEIRKGWKVVPGKERMGGVIALEIEIRSAGGFPKDICCN